jgi:hypothetical protein
MNDHALIDGPLDFPMMGWPYYVRNPAKTISFINDLNVEADDASADADKLKPLDCANISFCGLNYPTMNEYWGKNREIRVADLNSTQAGTAFSLTHTVPASKPLSFRCLLDDISG